MSATWHVEQELRVNANQLLAGLIATSLWIYCLADHSWVVLPSATGGLFTLTAQCKSHNGTQLENINGTWANVCTKVLGQPIPIPCSGADVILLPGPAQNQIEHDTKLWADFCLVKNSSGQVSYALIIAVVASFVGFGIGLSLLMKSQLATKYVAALPFTFYCSSGNYITCSFHSIANIMIYVSNSIYICSHRMEEEIFQHFEARRQRIYDCCCIGLHYVTRLHIHASHRMLCT